MYDADSLDRFNASSGSSRPPAVERASSSGGGTDTKRKRKTKAVLTPAMALEIYSNRRADETEGKTAESGKLASRYGVSPKCVRDIWDRRTWTKKTRQMWTVQEQEEYDRTHLRGRGRPPGSKDSKPRRPRIKSKAQSRSQHAANASLC
eukprot:231587-Hanusia_phi.AAC.1